MRRSLPAGSDPRATLRVQTRGSARTAWAVLAAAAVLCAIALGARSPTPWSGLGFVAAWLTFFLVGSAWLPLARGSSDAWPRWYEPLRFVVVALVAGLATAVVLWSLAAFFVKSLAAGMVAVLGIAVAGALRVARRRPPLVAAVAPVPVAIAGLAFVLGCHVLGVNEVGDGQRLTFTYRWDWPIHLYWAGLIRELGLPLAEPSGVGVARYASLYHTGMLVALGGVAQLTATSLYQAARILGIGALVVIALAGGCLTARLRLPAWQSVVCGLAPLVWACLSLPLDLWRGNWAGILDPYIRSSPMYSAASGSMYHNLPQLGAILIGAGALVSLDRYRARGDRKDLLLCGLLLGLSTAFKPSVAIVFGPAVLVVLAVGGAPWRALAAFAAALAAGSVLYALPALLARLPAGPRWTVHPEALGAPERLLDLAVLGVVLPLALARVVEIVRARGARRWTVLDVMLVAVGGGLLFAMLFVEQGRVGHGNHIWSRCAALVLLAPYATGAVLRFVDRSIARPAAHPVRCAGAVLVALMLALQLASGALYAVRYPTLRPVEVRAAASAAVRTMAELTPPTARLVADGAIARGPLLPYLPRRVVFSRGGNAKAPPSVLQWRVVTAEKPDPGLAAFLAGRDGALLGGQTKVLRPLLRDLGWTLQLRSWLYELWLPSNAARAAP